MLFFALGALLAIVIGVRRVLTRDERARHREIAREIEGDLRHLLIDCVYPGYSRRVALSSWLERRHLLWGRMVIVILVSADRDLRSALEDILVQRILTLLEKGEYGSDVVVLPIFLWRDRRNARRRAQGSYIRRSVAAGQ